jgi:glycolate oxidase iron-sulfur subunit
MRTAFSKQQLADPHMAESETSLRKCVHCGFCTATCPTYVLLGDERDSPRGRIMLIQQMLEDGGAPTPETVTHIDRCLSCLGCRTTCPSGVDYAALVDTARVHIAKTYRRPLGQRLFRGFVQKVLMSPGLFSVFTALGRLLAPLAVRLPGKLGAMARKVPKKHHLRPEHHDILKAPPDAARVAVLEGCVQKALAPEIDLAARRVLARGGFNAEPLSDAGCCGALALHMGDEETAKANARRVIATFEHEETRGALAGLLSNATGCAAFLKDYPRLFLGDAAWHPRAIAFAERVRDFTELAILARAPSDRVAFLNLNVAYHPPCSLQHGQRIVGRGEALLTAAGFRLVTFSDSHLCCGSAGSYSILQPEISDGLKARKIASIKASGANIIASGNAGCLTQLSATGGPATAHIAELLDWAEGGPKPAALGE